MYESHVRFMILGEHELCQSVATAQNPQGHNSHLNIEQMNKVMLCARIPTVRLLPAGALLECSQLAAPHRRAVICVQSPCLIVGLRHWL